MSDNTGALELQVQVLFFSLVFARAWKGPFCDLSAVISTEGRVVGLSWPKLKPEGLKGGTVDGAVFFRDMCAWPGEGGERREQREQ